MPRRYMSGTNPKGAGHARPYAVAVVLLITTAQLAARADEPPPGQKYALLVGVQQYSEAKELRRCPTPNAT